jgi:NADP-dependent 3-hydroxy acid dehydrogenase YdfG
MTDEPERKVAWVTGAGKGIGRALAVRLAQESWTVAASARTAEDLASLAAECPPGRVHEYPLDITDLAQTRATVHLMERQLGEIDLAVLNAGTHIPMAAEHFSVESFRHLVETNLMGTANGLEQIIPKFIERKSGHIAVVASLAGYRGLPTAAAYGATKAGLINMCEALKPELERHSVRLTLINPGFVETPLTDSNEFPMPYLIPAEKAADRIIRGLRRGDFEVAFPWRFAILMKLLRLLPNRLFFLLTRRMIGG